MTESIFQTINAWAVQSLGTFYLAFPLYFAAGLLSSLFPCVYPLYPITAGFLRSRSSPKDPVWKHPLFYWFGLILVYALLGAIAVISGGSFNRVMQSGIFIMATGFLFLFLVFVSLDWFSLHWAFSGRWTSLLAAKEGTFFTFLMGGIAGLTASACVAPVLVSMLVLLAQNSASGGFYKTWQGASLCLAFGGGIGLPFFITGVLGARLPRFGRWHLFIKYSFSVGIALAAVYQIHKGFQVLGWSSVQIYLVLGAMFLLFLAVLMDLRPPQANDRRAQTKFYFALLAVAFAFAAMVRAFSYDANAASQKIYGQEAHKNEQQYETIGQLRFYRSRDFALNLAQKQKRPVFIDFYADWCANCLAFTRLMENNKSLQKTLRKAVLLKIYDTDSDFDVFRNDPRFPELKIGLPFFAVLKADGSLQWKTTDYRDILGMQKAIDAGP